MALVTQDEIINTMNVDDHLSVNNISNSTITKAELYIANTFLGEAFYTILEADKASTGTFNNANIQLLYNNYLLRLISEYVLTICLNDIILKVANKGIENTNQVDVYGVSKAAYQDEFERSKVMADSYLIKNKANFSTYLGNDIDSTTDKIIAKTAYGFFIE